jgi:hypothetical protein
LKRHYSERLADWSEPGAVQVNRNGTLLEPPSVPDWVKFRKWHPKIPWIRPRR